MNRRRKCSASEQPATTFVGSLRHPIDVDPSWRLHTTVVKSPCSLSSAFSERSNVLSLSLVELDDILINMLLSFKTIFIGVRSLTFFLFVLVWVLILCEDYWKTNEKAEAALGLAVIGNIVLAISLGLLVADMSTLVPKRVWICVMIMMALFALVAGVLVATQANSCRPEYCVNSGMYAAAAAFSIFALFSIVADLIMMIFFSHDVY